MHSIRSIILLIALSMQTIDSSPTGVGPHVAYGFQNLIGGLSGGGGESAFTASSLPHHHHPHHPHQPHSSPSQHPLFRSISNNRSPQISPRRQHSLSSGGGSPGSGVIAYSSTTTRTASTPNDSMDETVDRVPSIESGSSFGDAVAAGGSSSFQLDLDLYLEMKSEYRELWKQFIAANGDEDDLNDAFMATLVLSAATCYQQVERLILLFAHSSSNTDDNNITYLERERMKLALEYAEIMHFAEDLASFTFLAANDDLFVNSMAVQKLKIQPVLENILTYLLTTKTILLHSHQDKLSVKIARLLDAYQFYFCSEYVQFNFESTVMNSPVFTKQSEISRLVASHPITYSGSRGHSPEDLLSRFLETQLTNMILTTSNEDQLKKITGLISKIMLNIHTDNTQVVYTRALESVLLKFHQAKHKWILDDLLDSMGQNNILLRRVPSAHDGSRKIVWIVEFQDERPRFINSVQDQVKFQSLLNGYASVEIL